MRPTPGTECRVRAISCQWILYRSVRDLDPHHIAGSEVGEYDIKFEGDIGHIQVLEFSS